MRTATTTTSMKPGTSGRKGGKHSEKRIMPTIKIKCAMIAHFIFLPHVEEKRIPKAFLKKTKNCFAEGIDRIEKYDILKV